METYTFKKKRGKGVGFALLLILIGGVFLLFNMGVIPAVYKQLLISWQMLLIVLGIGSFFKRQYATGVILLGIGGFFIYPTLCSIFPQYFVSLGIDLRTYWPIILIIVGAFLVINSFFPSSKKHCTKWKKEKWVKDGNNSHQQSNADFVESNMMFGNSEQLVLSQNFMGGDVNVLFGEVIIDLRKAKLAEGSNRLEVNIAFGSVIIFVPEDWVTELQGSTVLGAFEDKRRQSDEVNIADAKSRLIIVGSCMLGSGEIKN